jgi:hypothetical protein
MGFYGFFLDRLLGLYTSASWKMRSTTQQDDEEWEIEEVRTKLLSREQHITITGTTHYHYGNNTLLSWKRHTTIMGTTKLLSREQHTTITGTTHYHYKNNTLLS